MHACIHTDRQTYRHIDIQTYRHTHVYISILVQHRPLSLPSKFDLDPRNMPKFVKQDWICPRNDWLYIYIYILYIYLMGYIYIHMHIICIIPLEVLLLILLPGCTTLPGTAERPFPSIEGSTRRQSQVEGAPRCCDEPWDFTGSRVACVQTKPMGKSKKKGQMLSHGDRSIGSLSRSRKRSWSTSMTTKCTPSMRKPATWENLSLGFGYWLGRLWKFGCHPTKIARGWG